MFFFVEILDVHKCGYRGPVGRGRLLHRVEFDQRTVLGAHSERGVSGGQARGRLSLSARERARQRRVDRLLRFGSNRTRRDDTHLQQSPK